MFFDRDGIANVAPQDTEYYVLSPERLFIEDAFLDALRVVEQKGFVSVIVTNQKCVHRGLITMQGLDAIHDKLRRAVTGAGLALLDIYVSPHGGEHPDRKPAPGMLLRAAKDHSIDLGRSWMIGDSERDIQAGKAAGCAWTVFVNDTKSCDTADVSLGSINDLPGYLDKNLPHA